MLTCTCYLQTLVEHRLRRPPCAQYQGSVKIHEWKSRNFFRTPQHEKKPRKSRLEIHGQDYYLKVVFPLISYSNQIYDVCRRANNLCLASQRPCECAHSGAVGGIQDVLGLKIKNPLHLPSFLDQRRFPASQQRISGAARR